MIFDLHTDLPTFDTARKNKLEFVQKNADTVMTLAVWTSELTNPLQKVQDTVKTYSHFKNVRFAIEDSWFVTENNMFEIVSLPLLYCTLAWGGNNALAGGHLGDGALTELGNKFIATLNGADIAVDTAHLNVKSFYKVLESGKKVLCSHTCLYSVYPHTRNLTDSQIKDLISAGGVVGIAAVSSFMGKAVAGRADYVEQFVRFADKFGTEALCVGTDFFGTEPLDGFSSYDDAENLKCDLIGRGFSERETDDILFNNANNFYS